MPDKSTYAYYEKEADRYFARTVEATPSDPRDRFLREVGAPAKRLLDAGCGSGRDAKVFIEAGHEVEAFDASPAMAAHAARHIGKPVAVLTFEALRATEPSYDGIWACASLMHLPAAELPNVLNELRKTLLPGGLFYCCFKLGKGERHDANGRFFNDLEPETLERLLNGHGFAPEEIWVTGSVLPGVDERWVNALSRRVL